MVLLASSVAMVVDVLLVLSYIISPRARGSIYYDWGEEREHNTSSSLLDERQRCLAVRAHCSLLMQAKQYCFSCTAVQLG